jgi:predicted amidohydrolase
VLLQARAIENLCYLMASAQCGLHENGRETFGHSIHIAPWGNIVAELGASPGILVSTLDLSVLSDLRKRFPALSHRRL